MYEICANTFFKGKFLCAPSLLVCAHLTTCVRAHSLEGTLHVGNALINHKTKHLKIKGMCRQNDHDTKSHLKWQQKKQCYNVVQASQADHTGGNHDSLHRNPGRCCHGTMNWLVLPAHQ